MSWLWGGRKTPLPENFGDFMPPSTATGGGGSEGDDGKGGRQSGAMEAYRFDSSALERAAEAAKQLEKSSNAKECLELSRQQEITKQNEAIKTSKQLELEAKHLEMNMEKMRQEERINLLKKQAEIEKEKLHLQDQLARQRQNDQMEQQRRLNDDMLRKQEESTLRQEQLRRETLEHELEKRAQIEERRVEKEVLAKGQVARDNHHLTLEEIRLKAKEDRQTKLESIKSIGTLMGEGLHSFLGDRQRFQMAVGGTVAVIAGYFAAKHGIGTVVRYVEARLFKPSLVRETSRLTMTDTFKHPVDTIRKIRWRLKASGDALEGIILPPKVEAAIRDIALETKACRQAKGAYRNLLLHGPPGTGKTLFARKLSHNSGMDYAIMAGGDIQKMKDDSVEAVEKMFEWVRTSRRGLILFIDEAESFLIRRDTAMSENLRNTLSTFLSYSGTHNDKFMLVLTSNIPTVFDAALMNRVQAIIEFPLPGLEERTRLVGHYFEEYVLKPAATGKWRIRLEDGKNWTEVVKKVARLTEGLSGREIASLALDWKMKTTVSEDGVLTEALILECTDRAMERKRTMVVWNKQSFQQQDGMKAFSAALIDAIKSGAAAPQVATTVAPAAPSS